MDIWFLGSGDFAASCFRHLIPSVRFSTIVTAPPRPAGRGLQPRVTPLQAAAAEAGLEVLHSSRLSRENDLIERFTSRTPDVLLVIDFGQLILPPFLDQPRFGCLNVHPSLLPSYRGAAPIQRALCDGVSETGVTVFRLVREMDAGPVLAQERVSVTFAETSGEMFGKMSALGSQMLLDVLKCLPEGRCMLHPQEGLASYAAKIVTEETKIDWNNCAASIHNRVRAFNPTPGVWSSFRGRRLKIWRTLPVSGDGAVGSVLRVEPEGPVVCCGSDALLLLEVQAEGKARCSGADWARGLRLSCTGSEVFG